MSIVFLNGSYMPMSEAKISPLDRGFLFGDGIYEVIPSYQGNLLGFGLHIDRMNDGFKGIGLNVDWSHQQWKTLCDLASIGSDNSSEKVVEKKQNKTKEVQGEKTKNVKTSF